MHKPGTGDALGGRLADSFRRHGKRAALECGDEQLSYDELDRRASALADLLTRAGIGPGDCVALLLPRSIHLVVAELALLRLGAIHASLDLASPPARHRVMLETLRPRLVLSDGLHEAGIPEGLARMHPAATRPPRLAEAGAFSRFDTRGACVMFTSGSTGAPKAALIPREGIARLVHGKDFAILDADARWAFMSSPAFDISMLETWGPLCHGGCCVIQPRELPSIDELAAFLIERRISDAWLTSALFSTCVDLRPDAFAGLRQVLAGGERVSPHHARTLLLRYPEIRLINGYGPTENTTFTTCHSVSLADTGNPDGIPIGRPIRGTKLRIEGVGDVGELLAGGEGVALGYLNSPEQTARRFIFEGEERWYRTGDLVRRHEDGVYAYLGRADRQVKIQGHRVELDEVEAMLLRCRGVTDAAVLVLGETAETRRLVGCYVAQPDADPGPAGLRAELGGMLPPGAIPGLLMPVARMPLTLNGKVDRQTLAVLCEAGRQAPANQGVGLFHSASEALLAQGWSECLRCPVNSREADFWAHGGTSVMALQLSAWIDRQMGKHFSPVDILRNPILKEQAHRLDASPGLSRPAPRETTPAMPLSLAQQWWLDCVGDRDRPSAALRQLSLQFPASVSPDAVLEAFSTLAARHPALRMSVRRREDEGGFKAMLQDTLPPHCLQRHPALPAVPAPDGRVWQVMREACRKLDPASDGVMRVDVWPVEEGATLALWTLHRIAVDARSIDLCLAQLLAMLDGSPPPPGTRAAAWPDREQAWLDAGALPARVEALRAPLARQKFPADLVASTHARPSEVPVGPNATSSLMKTCIGLHVAPALAMLIAWAGAIEEVFGCEPVVLVMQSRRLEPELLPLVGHLVEACPMHVSTGGQSLAEAIPALRQAYAELAGPRAFDLAGMEALLGGSHAGLRAFAFEWEDWRPVFHESGGVSCVLREREEEGMTPGLTLRAGFCQDSLRLCLHAGDLVREAGLVAALENALRRKLDELAHLARLPGPAFPNRRRGLDEATLAVLNRVWRKHLGPVRGRSRGTGHFMLDGGSVDSALCMLMELRRLHCMQVDPGRFLASPDFATLTGSLVCHAPESSVVSELVGPADASRLYVMLPGKHGGILSLYRLASLIQAQLGDDAALLVLDLDALLEASEGQDTLGELIHACEERLRLYGTRRIAGMFGYSLGGLLALRLAERISDAEPPHVWLLDTCAPRLYSKSPLRRMGWICANLFHGHPQVVFERIGGRVLRRLDPVLRRLDLPVWRLPQRPRPVWEQWVNPHTLAAWGRLHKALAGGFIENHHLNVTLIVATRSQHESGVLWRRPSNGFDPHWFGGLSVRSVDLLHDAITHDSVGEAARLLASEFSRAV
ncbi:amino acid adenylation domain-containing protein [Uliginosibacterium paludis]|uniref:Amino acid adenylation domain-containing protein n=1 Tax=Uliginosibacterium paludis TaxID=1615952 RepID=A0ABV2CUP6_9RHOO